jgi:23S rRNA (cytosine1962-C5)-methyltransferase
MVVAPGARPLGQAMYSAESRISLRFVTWGEESIDETFWAARLDAAIARREAAGMGGPARRLVFGEADEWPGFVVDQYDDCLSVQTLTPAADRLAPGWVDLLVERVAPRAIVARNDGKVRRLEGLVTGVEAWHGTFPDPFPVKIGDHVFRVDVVGGQKTGAYLDQQKNYRMASGQARGARRALDVFAGDGGFALHLAAVADDVEAIESSAGAIARGQANAETNGFENIRWSKRNAFHRLHELAAAGERYDAIVLDPPAFAKNKQAVEGAERGYKEINLRAFKCLEPGGVLITCSCSYHVRRERLIEIVTSAAADAGRTIELVEIRAQSPDHPVLLNAPETEYLKCLVLRAR